MSNMLVNSVLAAIVGLGSLTFAPISAGAQEIELNLGRNGPTVRLRDACDPARENCSDSRRYGDRRDNSRQNRRDAERPRFCTEERALDKAERLGLRRARIDSVGRRSIDVRGRDRRGDRVEIRFGRAPNCPVIG